MELWGFFKENEAFTIHTNRVHSLVSWAWNFTGENSQTFIKE
jgi:hypothetical protein